MRNRLCCLTVLCLLFLLVSFGDSPATSQPESPVSSQSSISNPDASTLPLTQSLKSIMAFDPAWRPGEKSPFVWKRNRFELDMRIGSAQGIAFPRVLDPKTPIVIQTQYGVVKQFLESEDTYQAHLAGRYLVYRGRKNSILYRYDKEQQSLREFVYLEKPFDLPI